MCFYTSEQGVGTSRFLQVVLGLRASYSNVTFLRKRAHSLGSDGALQVGSGFADFAKLQLELLKTVRWDCQELALQTWSSLFSGPVCLWVH